MRAPTAIALLSLCALPLMGGCDTKPNKGFEADVQEARAKQSGDKFSTLNGYQGRLTRYLQAEEAQRPYYLASFATASASAVSTALETLTALPVPAKAESAARDCKTSITAALAFKSAPPADGAQLVLAAEAGMKRLEACRLAAQAQEKTASEDDQATLQGWRRAASTAMMVLGTTVIERGQIEPGVKLWREADKAMTADKPGYRFKAQDLAYGIRR